MATHCYRRQVREVINPNTVVSLALEQGFNAFLPVYDGGIDFILYRDRRPYGSRPGTTQSRSIPIRGSRPSSLALGCEGFGFIIATSDHPPNLSSALADIVFLICRHPKVG